MDDRHVPQAMLSGLRDGRLSPADDQLAQAHLATCGVCRARIEDLSALGSLLTDRRELAASELPAAFSARVMSLLTAAQAPAQGVGDRLREFLGRRKEQLALGLLALAAAAALAIVFFPSLRSASDQKQEAVENEAQIHSLELSSPDVDAERGDDSHAVVLQSAEGNTVIWVFSPPPAPPVSAPAP